MEQDNIKLPGGDERELVKAFLEQITRDFRTYINKVVGSSELILHEDVDRKVRDSVNEIKQSAKRLMSLADESEDLIGVLNGGIGISPEEYCVMDPVLEMRRYIETEAKPNGIECETSFDKNLPYRMIGDYNRIREMVEKLVAQAFAGNGVKKVSVFLEGLPAVSCNMFVRINVSDDGDGYLAPEVINMLGGHETVVEDELRKNDTMAGEIFLVKYLAVALGGKLTAKRVKGKGCSFTLLIPQKAVGRLTVSDYDDYVEDHPAPDVLYTAKDARILVVTKDEGHPGHIASMLRDRLICADVTSTLEDAEELTDLIRYDLLILEESDESSDELWNTCYEKFAGKLPVIMIENGQTVHTASDTQNFDTLVAPVTAEQLDKLLKTRLPSDKLKFTSATATGGKDIDTLEKLGINTKAALDNFDGDSEEYRNVLVSMCRSSDTKGKMLQYYLEQRDYKNYIVTMHGILGVARMIGAEWLAEKSIELEKAAKQGLRELIEKETPALADSFDKLLSSIRSAIITKDDAAAKGAIARDDLVGVIEELKGYLEDYRIEEVEELFYTLAQFSYPDDHVIALIHKAEESMLNYQYNDVLTVLDDILAIL